MRFHEAHFINNEMNSLHANFNVQSNHICASINNETEIQVKEHVLSVIIVGIVSSVVAVLSPEGEGGGLGKSVKCVTGLVMILICTAPIISLFDSLKGLDLHGIFAIAENDKSEYESVLEESFSAAEIANTKEGIKRLLGEKFGIDEGEVNVSVQVATNENGERIIKRIFITLYGSAIWKDTGEIEQYLGDLFGCEVVTAID